MDNFQIETAQNISITQNVAGIGERILAYLIDLLFMLAYIIFASLVVSAIGGTAGEEWVIMLLIALPLLLYFLLWEMFWNGRSPGKAAMELRVVKLDGTKPTIYNFLVRWLLRVVDITLTSGSVAVVTILLNGKGQRLGDLAAGTTVISEKERIDLSRAFLYEVPENYTPVYPQVSVLSDKDVQNIRSLYRDALANSNYRVISSLATKVSELLKVVPASNSSEFIETVLKDYKYYTQQ